MLRSSGAWAFRLPFSALRSTETPTVRQRTSSQQRRPPGTAAEPGSAGKHAAPPMTRRLFLRIPGMFTARQGKRPGPLLTRCPQYGAYNSACALRIAVFFPSVPHRSFGFPERTSPMPEHSPTAMGHGFRPGAFLPGSECV